MNARFAGRCRLCSKEIAVGMPITWNRRGERGVLHVNCEDVWGKSTVSVTPSGECIPKRKASEGVSIAVGKDGIAHVVKPDLAIGPITETEARGMMRRAASAKPEVKSEPITVASKADAKPADAKPADAPKADAKPEALKDVSANAAWYEVLQSILPHVTRILLVGPPATGKSTTAMKVAGCKYRVTMTETTSREDLIGMFHLIDGETKWIDGPITSAMRNGETVLVDEIDRYSPEAASLLYALIDDKPHLSLPNGEMLYAASGYKMIMTSNEGLDSLPVAVQDRIEVVLSAHEPHADAIADMSKAMQSVVTCYYRALPKAVVKLPTTVRRMRTLHLLLEQGLHAKLAATIVFGTGASEVLSVISSAENSLASV